MFKFLVTIGVAMLLNSPSSSGAPEPYGEAPKPNQRVVMVTGSTGGLGREIARELANRGDHVIVHGRNQERGRALVDAISEASGSARFYVADFGDLNAVKALAKAIQSDYCRLDVLVNNAGIALPGDKRRLSEDGQELHFQVNYLAGYLLAESLLPMLRESEDGRIVNVSSLGQAPVDFDDLTLEKDYSLGRAYSVSKHAQIMHAKSLAEDPLNASIKINALHPSTFMDTDMIAELGAEPRTSVLTGRDAVIRLIDEDVDSGDFYDVQKKTPAQHEQASNAQARERLAQISKEIIADALQ